MAQTPQRGIQTLDHAIRMEVENLRRASITALREKYQEVFQQETQSRHREHLFRRIAWRLQALAKGDLSERARKRAHDIANDADLRIIAPRDFFNEGGECVTTAPSDAKKRRHDSRVPAVGTVLRREWKGRTVLVEVLESGFRYESRQYGSLSNIAAEVTGTRWNGFAFFGLMPKARRARA